nr:PepSY domain-containing protein [uncultured Sphingomonas sp.]
MIIKSAWLRKIHKWIGLIIGVQFLIWAISGAMMALLPMSDVEGGAMTDPPPLQVPSSAAAWPNIRAALGNQPVSDVTLRRLPGGPVVEVTTEDGVQLFDATDGHRLRIDQTAARSIAAAAHPAGAVVASVSPLTKLTLPVREHSLPIWQVDFADEGRSSYFVSGATGELLERRNDSWRTWDFFWMLHNMDYAKRTSFNHPLIIMVGLAMSWLAVTGFWLLFRTMWRHDFAQIRRFAARLHR